MQRITLPCFVILALVMTACQASPATIAQTGSRPPTPDKRCGDGVCDGPETIDNCPADCSLPSAADNQRVLYLGLMIHLEGWGDDEDEAKFEQHAQIVREWASLFESYGAKLTFESKELTDGSIRWGDNVLLEMQQRGHGVGVHADIGGQQNYNCARFSDDLRAEKEQLETLGVVVRHLSGNTSHCDWVTASADAGYLFTTGIVSYSVMSMPEALRPPEYRDCKTPSECHDVIPADLAERIHPWRANSGLDWLTHDPNGRLVILAENGEMPTQMEDIDAFIAELEEAISLAEPGMVNIYYVGKSIGSPVETGVVEAWLQRLQPYVQSGQVQWMTLPEMYAAYVQWEQGQ
ncbi:MAG: hypothetical protein P8Z42_02450 [Anaerolineales bacterium]|jgi:hypothetical protein